MLPVGVSPHVAVQQFWVPVVDPLMICTDVPLTVKVCSQVSVQLPVEVHVLEQFAMVSGAVITPLLPVAHELAFGGPERPCDGLHEPWAMNEIVSATAAFAIGFFEVSSAIHEICRAGTCFVVPGQVIVLFCGLL